MVHYARFGFCLSSCSRKRSMGNPSISVPPSQSRAPRASHSALILTSIRAATAISTKWAITAK
eukprot:scaffold11645_cov60-Phaeocystis_antarctica.AAC.3